MKIFQVGMNAEQTIEGTPGIYDLTVEAFEAAFDPESNMYAPADWGKRFLKLAERRGITPDQFPVDGSNDAQIWLEALAKLPPDCLVIAESEKPQPIACLIEYWKGRSEPKKIDFDFDWDEFFELLEQRLSEEDCDPKGGCAIAQSVLREEMGAPESVVCSVLRICEATGGYCDCEILMNTRTEAAQDRKLFERAMNQQNLEVQSSIQKKWGLA